MGCLVSSRADRRRAAIKPHSLREFVGDATGLDVLGIPGEVISELLERLLGELGLLPEVRGEVPVENGQSVEGSLGEIAQGGRRPRRGSEAVSNASILKNLLGSRSRNNSSTTRGRDQADVNRTALAMDFVGDSVGQTDFLTPIPTADRYHSHFRSKNRTTNGICNFLPDFDTKANMPIEITNQHESLETSALTSTRLLLDRLNFHHLVLQLVRTRRAKKIINDLVLLDRHREQIDVLKRLDLSSLDQTTELGARNPLLFVTITTATTTSAAPAKN